MELKPIPNTDRWCTADGRVFRNGIECPVYITKYTGRESKYNRYGAIHTQVAKAWLSPSPNRKPYIVFKDGNSLNVHKDNLEWATRSEERANFTKRMAIEKNKTLSSDAAIGWLGNYGFSRLWATTDGKIFTFIHGEMQVLKTYEKRGYRTIWFQNDSGIKKNIGVHRLIAMAHIPLPDRVIGRTDIEVNHLDGDPLNNVVSNLEWCTAEENKRHSWDKLRTRVHSKKQVIEICDRLQKGESGTTIAKDLKVSNKFVSEIYCGKAHRDVSSSYKFPKIKRISRGKRHASDEIIHAVCKRLETGEYDSLRSLAKEIGVSEGLVYRLNRGEGYSEIVELYN